jgi:hypothetical protein
LLSGGDPSKMLHRLRSAPSRGGASIRRSAVRPAAFRFQLPNFFQPNKDADASIAQRPELVDRILEVAELGGDELMISDRGLGASASQKKEVLSLVRQLQAELSDMEVENTGAQTLSATWRLAWTTEQVRALDQDRAAVQQGLLDLVRQ